MNITDFKNDRFNKIKGLEELRDLIIVRQKKEERDSFIELHRTGDGLESILNRYNFYTYTQAAKEFQIAQDDDVAVILKIKTGYISRKPIGIFSMTLDTRDLSPERKSQVEGLQEGLNDNWRKKLMEGAIIGEKAACEFANKNVLPIRNLSEEDRYSRVDCIINGVEIDVKSRIRIGQRSDLNFHATRWDNKEVVMLVSVSCQNYDSKEYQTQIVGILDLKLMERNGFTHLLKELTWISEPFFVDAFRYFKLMPEEVGVDLNLRAFKYYLDQEKYEALRGYFGEKSYIKGLLDSERFPFLNDLLTRLVRLHLNGDDLLSGLAVFDWLLEKMRRGKVDFEGIDLKKVLLDQLTLTYFQRKYLETLLLVVSSIPALKCKFTSKPLSSGEIVFRSGILKVYLDGHENVLFAYSRYNGEILTILKNGVCDHPLCACLIHEARGTVYGKTTCPRYGVERDIKLRKEMLNE